MNDIGTAGHLIYAQSLRLAASRSRAQWV